MKFEGIININKVIVHILNQKEGKHKLSEFEITTDQILNNLIIKHINNSITNDSRMFAKFNGKNNIVRSSCVNILKDSQCFIEESKSISEQLFKAMRGTNASPANFLIVEYTHGKEKAIALLKLDFNENFYTEEIIENGKNKIIIKLKSDGFNKNQKLQKCAFIYDDVLKDIDCNILILDKQKKEDVTTYFGISFLNSILVNDYKVNTRKMISELTEFINTEYKESPKEQMDKTYLLTSILNKAEDFDLNNILDRIFDKDDEKKEFRESIKSKEIDYVFKIDKPRVEKRLKNRFVVTENGILLRGKASLFSSNDIEISDKDDDGNVNITINKVKIKDNNF